MTDSLSLGAIRLNSSVDVSGSMTTIAAGSNSPSMSSNSRQMSQQSRSTSLDSNESLTIPQKKPSSNTLRKIFRFGKN
uniref:Uncharacterized protein n=1 Tax=Ditylenchus dipsaci TaxID=166011 RepID=A0A915CZL9_9BILA